MKKLIILTLILISIGFETSAQGIDPQLSLFNDQPTYMNPALVGNFDYKWRVNTSYRDQYSSISTPYRTIATSFDINLPINAWAGNIWGFGLSVFQDAQSDVAYTSTNFNASFSIGQYLDPRENHSLSVGFLGGYGQRAIDYSNLNYWDSQWVGTGFQLGRPTGEPFNNDVRGYADLSTGLQYTYNGEGLVDVRAGLAMQHFNRPEIGLYRDGQGFQMDRQFGIHADMEYRFNRDSRFYIRPSAYYTIQGEINNMIIGNDFVFMFNEPTRTTGKRKEYSMTLGVFHRAGFALKEPAAKDAIATIKLNLAGFTFGSAYDFNIGSNSSLTGYQGALEVFVSYKAGFKKGSVNGYQRFKTGKL
jgi:type IX secretion system PorP/SprF family membrane protein